MNSSTSNFNSSGVDNMTSRKIFLKISLAIFLCASLAMILVRVYTELNGANKHGIMGRVAAAQASLPKITQEPNELVMFYGSSMTDAGFSPRRFDKTINAMGKDIKSFNFGFGGLNPYFQDLLSRRIAEEFKSNDRRLKLAMIEFNPFQATQARWNRAAPIVDSFLTMLASDKELFEIALQDLTRGIRLFNIKYMRNQVSAEMVTSFYSRMLFPPQQTQTFPEDEAIVAERDELTKELGALFAKEFPDYHGEDWYYPWQGAGAIPEERSAHTLAVFGDYYRVIQNDATMQNDRLSRINSADIEELNFEPLMIESFIQIIKNFQQFSDQVEVMMLPRNTRWIHYSPAAQKRLSAAIAQIEAATGVKILDHQTLTEIDPSMFRDTTHLARYRGDLVYTDFLVKQFADNL